MIMFVTFFLSVAAFDEVALHGSVVTFDLFPWVSTGNVDVRWSFLFDSLTTTMLLVVTGVSTLVHVYSSEYMAGDPHLPRFMSYLSLFTFFMLMLVTGGNLLQLFLGWEGVGLCSFLLINFWFTRIQANKAAIKAMLVNRVGDVGLILAIIAIYAEFDSIDYNTVLTLAHLSKDMDTTFLGVTVDSLTVIGILLFVGAVGKSAQLGLHTWLPDAMEGPTPVSALIHAATMVTAGVFLLARFSPLLEHTSTVLTIITLVGGMTALFAAMTGLAQNDMKRVIAYSTCSQLGYMVFAAGLSSYGLAVFHLANHACFKALLFLSAGAVIHSIADEQDMRKMGGLASVLPFSFAMITVGSAALMGVPFLTGFYSKDVILELSVSQYGWTGLFAFVMGVLAAVFTTVYSVRLGELVFFGRTAASSHVIHGVHDAPMFIAVPMITLATGSAMLGWFTKDAFIGIGTPLWSQSIYIDPSRYIAAETEWLVHSIKLIPFYVTILALATAAYMYDASSDQTDGFEHDANYRMVHTFFNRKWFWDKVYTDFVSQTVMDVGYRVTYKTVDRGVLEHVGPYGATILVTDLSSQKSIQTGVISDYLQRMVLVMVLFGMVEIVMDTVFTL
jgi:proton-translocating NADH-quinone oxidoreductase chain L